MQVPRIFGLNSEDNETDNDQEETKVAQPQAILRCRSDLATLLSPSVDPKVAQRTAHLLANEGANDQTQELKANLLRVEGELFDKDLRDFNGEEDAGEAKDDCVGKGGNHDRGILGEACWLNKLIPVEWLRVKTLEVEVLSLEGTAGVLDALTDVTCLGAEEEVSNKLYTVDLGRLVTTLLDWDMIRLTIVYIQ